MSNINERWAKLYTQVDSQMLVTITPSDNGFLVEKQMMIAGELNAVTCYDGGDEDYAREVFKEITRDDVALTANEFMEREDESPLLGDKNGGTVGPNKDGEHFQEDKFVDIAVTLENIEPKEGVVLKVFVEGEDKVYNWDGTSLIDPTTEDDKDGPINVFDHYKEKLFLIVTETKSEV